MSAPMFNLGHVLTAGAMIVGGAVAWGMLTADQQNLREADARFTAALAEGLARVEGSIDQLAVTLAGQESRLRAQEMQSSRTDEKLAAIIDLLERLERQMAPPPR